MGDWNRVPIDEDAYRAIYTRYRDKLVVFSIYTSESPPHFYTEFGFKCHDYPIIGSDLSAEPREYWLCVGEKGEE